MKVCPICGKQYSGEIPAKCDHCGYPSDKFKEYKGNPSTNFVRSTNTRTYSVSDERAVRIGAGIAFVSFIIIGTFFIFIGFMFLFGTERDLSPHLGDISSILVGVGGIVLGILTILEGWIIRCSIRIFANMSERLSSIDSKLG